MKNIRKVIQINYTTDTGADGFNCTETYETEEGAAGRYNVLMNRNIEAEVIDMYEVGTSLGTFAGSFFTSLETAKKVAIKNYGEAMFR